MFSLLQSLLASVRSFRHDQGPQQAAALTLSTLFAVVPLMTVTLAIVQSLPFMAVRAGELQNWLLGHLLPAVSLQLQSHLQEFSRQAHRLTYLGLLMLLFTSVWMLMKIEASFNAIWRVRARRAGIDTYLRYWALLSLGPVLLATLLAVSSYLATCRLWSPAWQQFDQALAGLDGLQLIISCAAFSLLYAVVPNCQVPWSAAMRGGVLAGGLFELAKHGFAFFITSFSTYTLIYGAFAIFPVFLLWLQLSWMIVLLGGHFSRVCALPQSVADEVDPFLMLLQVLAELQRRQAQGQGLPELAGMRLAHAPHHDEWRRLVDALTDLQLVSRDAAGTLYLARDLRVLSLYEVAQALPWPWPRAQALAALRQEPWVLRLGALLVQLRSAEARCAALSLAELLDDTAPGLYNDALTDPASRSHDPDPA